MLIPYCTKQSTNSYDMTGQETAKFAIELMLFRAKLDQNKYETAPSWKDIMIKD